MNTDLKVLSEVSTDEFNFESENDLNSELEILDVEIVSGNRGGGK